MERVCNVNVRGNVDFERGEDGKVTNDGDRD